VAEAEHLDIDWHRGGQIDVARGPHEVPALEAALEELRRFDLAEGWELLDRAALAQRIDVSGATAGLATPDAAVLHPGKLVRQLARLVERMGATIHEQTHVTEFRPRGGSPGEGRPTLITERGEIRAERIVLAGEVYLTRLRQLHRTLIPAWSQIVLSEPLPDSAWEQIGWQRHELIGSPRLTVVYLARTADGRILFGGRGAPYRFGSAIADEYGRHEPTFETLRSLARAWFPALRDIGFSHAWGGAVGMPRDWHPTIVHDAASGIAPELPAGNGTVIAIDAVLTPPAT
jgi:glycine/D-amino acid oxidase-like deaminating enzyme